MGRATSVAGRTERRPERRGRTISGNLLGVIMDLCGRPCCRRTQAFVGRYSARMTTLQPDAPPATVGSVEGIFIATGPGEQMQDVVSATALAGVGLDGDRYAKRTGTWSNDPRPDREITLIEAEAVEALAADHGIHLRPGESRRNLTTRSIRLNDLVGRRFRIGAVLCEGTRLCEPCSYLQGVLGQPVLAALARRGGLRAVILEGGEISVGDRVVPEEAPGAGRVATSPAS